MSYIESEAVKKIKKILAKHPEKVFVDNEVGMDCSFKTIEWIIKFENKSEMKSTQ